MTPDQVQAIVANGRFPGQKQPVSLVETHISWVIMTPDFVFKIKKPIQFSFLDFSTSEKRAFFCREELHLNKRLAPEMYLDVLPIGLADDGTAYIGDHQTPAIELCVWMKRMDDRCQMDRLLRKKAVSNLQLSALAEILARFHLSVVIPSHQIPYQQRETRADFEDLFRLESVCGQLFGDKASAILRDWRNKIARFLDDHVPRLRERAQSGFWVDGHGDLHSRNIFLLPEGPMVFDCIEFNPHFRKLDILNELAFLCMDLEAGGHSALSEVFMEHYRRHWPCIESNEDRRLFDYFKAYRANVRLKVTLLEWQQHQRVDLVETAKLYWNLMLQYIGAL